MGLRWRGTSPRERRRGLAVLDTGVHAAHADLEGKVVVGSNFSDSPFSDDRHGHGTHVAGIVAAATDNGEGIAGTGWNTKVRSIKVLDDDGGGWDSDIALGINEAIVTGASVVNMSFADTGNSRTVRQAVDAAVAAGLGCGGRGQLRPRPSMLFDHQALPLAPAA